MRRLLFVVSCCICLAMMFSVGELNAKNRRDSRDNSGGGWNRWQAEKVCLCHLPPGNPWNAHGICVGEPAVDAHLAHGDTLGSCPVGCGGEAGILCEEGQFCQRPEGECSEDAVGECVDVPPLCPQIVDPMCGCDGMTYGNECYAAAAEVTVAFPGECDEEQVCGGSAGETCDAGQYCEREEGECSEVAEGVCADIPSLCPTNFAPVCGCDGMTYQNECYAAAAEATVAFPGECDEVQVCGGSAGDTCAEGQFCKREEGECDEDAEGVCADIPFECTAVFEQVCGCDGKTYTNSCMADAAEVTVASTGECDEGEEQACGGSAGDTCGKDQFCKTAEGDCAEDAEGVCMDIPLVCPLALDPVCGCDEETYGSECHADGASVNVASTGECDEGQP